MTFTCSRSHCSGFSSEPSVTRTVGLSLMAAIIRSVLPIQYTPPMPCDPLECRRLLSAVSSSIYLQFTRGTRSVYDFNVNSDTGTLIATASQVTFNHKKAIDLKLESNLDSQTAQSDDVYRV